MRRCKKCGSTEGSTECWTFDMASGGPKKGQHVFESVGGVPGPEHWANRQMPTPPSRPANYLTADRSRPGPLLDSRTPAPSNPLYGRAPRPPGKLTTAEVRQRMGFTTLSWHQQILQECTPLCRGIPKTLHERLPWHVRSRRASNVNHLK